MHAWHTNCLIRAMNQSFASEINKIAVQAKAVELYEIKMRRRREMWAKVQSKLVLVVGIALVVTGFVYRQKLRDTVWDKFFAPAFTTQVDASTGQKLQDIKAAANQRDAVLDEIAK